MKWLGGCCTRNAVKTGSIEKEHAYQSNYPMFMKSDTISQLYASPIGEQQMSASTFKTVTSIVAWLCFIFGLLSIVAPTVIGITSGGLAGTINTVEDGQVWFFRHGLGWLLGIAFFATYLFTVKVRKSFD
jgi:hypothetical protein